MIIVRICEGMGNQMFQYAYARALKERGIDVRIDLDKTYDEKFEKRKNHAVRKNCIQNFRITIPSVDIKSYGKYVYLCQDTILRKVIFWLSKHFLWRYRFYEEDLLMKYSGKKVKIKGNCYVKGWFQDERYFKNIRSILLNEFTPRKKIKISSSLRNALNDPESVSIHIRRGDYVKLNWSLPSAYYNKAVAYIEQIYASPIFLIFSDDLRWAKENILINGRCIFVNEDGRLKDYEELFIMSRCKANIISNSTFSWWAAWLNQNEKKIVIAPKKWKIDKENIILNQWITI